MQAQSSINPGKTLVSVLVTAFLGLSVASCLGNTNNAITLALSTQTNPFFVQVRDGALDQAQKSGVTLNVQDAGDDALKMADQLSNARSMGAKVVLVNPVDSDAVSPSVRDLNEAQIPVIAIDRSSTGGELTSYVASDNVAGGHQAAKVMGEKLGGHGKILILQGTPGSSSSRDRGKGFKEKLADYPDIEIAAEQTAGFDRTKGLDVATNLLQAHPDVDGIFAENDEMALGAIEAVGSRAGKEIIIIGFDGTAEGLAAVKEGTMTASIAQQPRELGATAVRQAELIVQGKPVDAVVPVPVLTVTQDNVGDFLE